MKSADPRVGYFDNLSSRWDDEEPSGETMTSRLAAHADLLSLRAGQALLEVGCGTGKTTGWLAGRVAPARVTAVDFAPGMIRQARAKDIDADFVCADVCADDLGRERYDVVLCFHSFPHFRDKPAALRNLSRALRPDGRLIVMHLAGSRELNSFHASLDGPVRVDVLPSGDAWKPLLAPVGLEIATTIDRPDLFFLEAVPPAT